MPADRTQWLAAYRTRHEALERLRVLELATMTEQEALRRMWNLVCAGTPWRERRDYSGLVEQQRLFMKIRPRKEP